MASSAWALRRTHRAARWLILVLLVVLTAAANPSWGSPMARSSTLAPAVGSALQNATDPAPTGRAAFGLGPAGLRKVDGRTDFDWLMTPNATLTDHVAVENIGLSPLTLRLYPTDGINRSGGEFTLLPSNQRPVDVGAWVHLAIPDHATSVVVPGRSVVVVPIDVRVPGNATPGDHAGGIVASLDSFISNKKNAKVKFEQRVGVRIFLRISGALHPQLSVEGLTVSYRGTLNPAGAGNAHVDYRVVNTGNVNLAGHQRVRISGLLGFARNASAPDLPLLLPGGSITVDARLHGVIPQLLMVATVHITPLVRVGDVDPRLRGIRGATHFWAVPWLLLALVVGLGLGLIRFLRRRPAAGGGAHRTGDNRHLRGSPVSETPTDAPVSPPASSGVVR